jgi:hypothetical protein
MRVCLIALALPALAAAGSAAGGFPIVTAGRARCEIVLGQGALPVEKGAAEDLARSPQVMSGVAVPLVDEGNEAAGVPRLLVGPCKLSEASAARLRA